MADLILAGTLNLAGTLTLTTSEGGKVSVKVAGASFEAVVENTIGDGSGQGSAGIPVPIPPPPSSPKDPGLSVWVFKSFNQDVKANGKLIVTQGLCVQGTSTTASWPGMIQPSLMNPQVTINHIAINVVGDTGTTFPTGAPVTISTSGQ